MTRRSNLTLIIRAFVNDDGGYYGVVSDPGESDGWQATYSEFGELVSLIDGRLNTRLNYQASNEANTAVNTAASNEPDDPEPHDSKRDRTESGNTSRGPGSCPG